MKKLTLLIVLTFIIRATGSSQPCLPEGITFTNQAEIDNFQTNYPNCTEIEGDVIISGSDITNLMGLNVLTSIGGYLKIYDNDALTSLTGLENITSIEGNLIIGDYYLGGNPSMTSLTGLDNVTSIGGDLDIYDNDALTSLTGLDNITSIEGNLHIGYWGDGNLSLTSLTGLNNVTFIGEDLWISCNGSLTSLTGLDNVTFIGGSLEIYNSDALTSLTGLDNVSFIEGNVWIGDNYSLTSLTGLNNVTSVGGYLNIKSNVALTILTGLDNVTSIGRDLSILGNPALTSLTDLVNVTSIGGYLAFYDNDVLIRLTGLDNIDAGSISDMYIYNNPSLSICEVQSVCDYLVSPNGDIEIYGNATGCNSPEEVEEACGAGWVPDINFGYEFSIYPNPAEKEIFISGKNGSIINEVNIYNQIGQKVLHKKRITNTIDVSMLRQGMYIIELVSSESKIREKLIIR